MDNLITQIRELLSGELFVISSAKLSSVTKLTLPAYTIEFEGFINCFDGFTWFCVWVTEHKTQKESLITPQTEAQVLDLVLDLATV